MDLSRADDSKRSLGENQLGKDHQSSIRSTSSSSTSKSTSETSSRSNSVDGIKITDNEFINSSNQNNSLNSNFGSLTNCTPYISNLNSSTASSSISANATYNVNQDFLIRMAMQNNTSVNNTITNNNMFQNLYQTALNTTTTSSAIANSTISAAHLAALNPHNSAFQNLQQQNHSAHQQLTNQQNTNSQTNGHSLNLHNSTNSNSISRNSATTSIIPNADHLLSTMTNGTNQPSLLAVANNLMNSNGNGSVTNTNGITSNSLSSSLSTNGSTNSSSNGSIANNSQMIINEHFLNGTNSLLNQNQILASQSVFFPTSLIDQSASNLFNKKRKRSPQPIPQDLKVSSKNMILLALIINFIFYYLQDDAYWDRRQVVKDLYFKLFN